MKKILFLIVILILIVSCKENIDTSENNEFSKKLIEKEKEISELKSQIKLLENQINNSSDYYRFEKSLDSEINVIEKIKLSDTKTIDKKQFNDTLDISDNFFVYKHTAEILQTSDLQFESIIDSFDQVLTEYSSDYFVKVMTFYNGESLPLETENSKTDIHILLKPTELGYKNKTFIISDFYKVKLEKLEKNENNITLIFEHGKFPRKQERIIITPELVKFDKK